MPWRLFAQVQRAQSEPLVAEALRSFPAETARIDYISIAALRRYPEFGKLLNQSKLKGMSALLLRYGVHEDAIDRIVLGWQANAKIGDFYGIAAGRFPKSGAVAANDVVRNSSTSADQVHCLTEGPGSLQLCILRVSKSRLVFGTSTSLQEVAAVRSGARPSIAADSELARLFTVQTGSFAWGAAIDSGVPAWFQNLTPGQRDVRANWSRSLWGVQSLTYVARAEPEMRFHVDLACNDAASADHTTHMLGSFLAMAKMADTNRHSSHAYRLSSFYTSTQNQHSVIDIVARRGG